MKTATATLTAPATATATETAPTVAGLTGMSTCDWPGHLAATVFLQGCPWNCTYCHNRDLIDPRAPGVLEWSDILAFLGRRHGLLDGVVFSGGEPTRTGALPGAIRDVRALGLAVGLHTSGAFPSRLAQVLGDVHWVGLDIKALPEDYRAVVGRPGAGERAWRSLELVLASGVDHEIRTTVHPDSPATDRIAEIADRLRAAGVRTFALQQARAIGTREGFRADEPGWDDRFLALAAQVAALGFDRFDARPAH
jgi:pyruvate formate lyase activating enzyme